MKAAYIDTSALLAWLFGESRADEFVECINSSEVNVCSELCYLETMRAIRRAISDRTISENKGESLTETFNTFYSSLFRMSIDESTVTRASKSFPVEPVRSLDAIHLATALEYKKLYPELRLLSFDKRIIDNIEPLDFTGFPG